MRGIKSAGMLLAASNEPEKTVVEPIAPPPGAVPGERVWFGDAKDQASCQGEGRPWRASLLLTQPPPAHAAAHRASLGFLGL